MICFYHGDLDGKCSAAIVRKYNSKTRCFEVSYEKPIPFDQIRSDDEVVLVDFTPSELKDFKKLVDSKHLIWIDHHKVNIDKFLPEFDYVSGRRGDTNPSAAMLTWEYFFSGKDVPMAVQYTSDFDTWTHKFPESRVFEAGMSSVNSLPNSDVWKKLLDTERPDAIGQAVAGETETELDVILKRGKVVQDFKKNVNAEYLESYGFEVEFEGHKAIACNVAHCGSDFFESKDGPSYDLMIPFVFNGNEYIISLYSEKDDVDCAAIAKKNGGGGHKGASGFQIKELPFKKKGGIEK